MKLRFFGILQAILVGFVILSVVAVGCSTSPAAPSAGKEGEKPAQPAKAVTTMSIGSPSIGSGPNIISVGFSTLINKEKDIQTTVEATGGSDAVVRGIADGRTELGMANSLSAGNGLRGEAPFNQKIPLRLIVVGQPVTRQLFARADSGIKTPADLKGKKLIGKRKSLVDVEQLTNAILKVWGVPANEVKILEIAEANEGYEALKLGTADAGLFPATIGDANSTELAQTTDIVWLDLGPKMDALLKELNPAFFEVEIPAGKYRGLDKPVRTVSAGSAVFVTRDDVSEEIIYRITKLILSNTPADLKKIHATAVDFTTDNTLKTFTIPLHPGAIKYFKEIGKWTDAAEKRQQELLK